MLQFSRRVAVMDSTGARLCFFAERTRAEEMISDGLATHYNSREIRLTCHPKHAAGHSLPQYRDGQTPMMGPPLYTRWGQWTGAYGRRL